jgi:hypothetical protein
MSESAQDLRAQGERCIRLAKECSTPSVSEKLMALAADYFERAARLAAVQLQQQNQPEKE